MEIAIMGSKEASPFNIEVMRGLSTFLISKGHVLRTLLEEGCCKGVIEGAVLVDSSKLKIYSPSTRYNDHLKPGLHEKIYAFNSSLLRDWATAYRASHPDFDNLVEGSSARHSTIYGMVSHESLADVVVSLPSRGEGSGSFVAVKVGKSFNIPSFNLSDKSDLDKFIGYLSNF